MIWSIATWRAQDLFSGDPKAFAKFHKDLGLKAICIKIGNGLRAWEGLSPYVRAAKDAGLIVWGWWYFYGHKGEGQIAAAHATYLGIDGLALDIEGEWESRAGWTNSARCNKAGSLMLDLKNGFPGQLALCSWWHPEAHPKTPVKVFLNSCQWNMPQHYWIGRRSDSSAVAVVRDSLEMYGRVANWPANKTIPVLASFGQSYKSGGKEYWWKATVTQMKATHEYAIAHGCPGTNWWSLDYLLGRSGHEAPKIVETAFIDTLKKLQSVLPVPGLEEDLRHEADIIARSTIQLRRIAEQM